MSLSVHDLHVKLASTHVLKGIDFAVNPGERIAILGPNGCGKSTLLRTLCSILRPMEGEVRLDDRPLKTFRRRERAVRIGLLSQADVVPMMTTVRDHVAIGRHPHRRYFNDRVTQDAAFIDAAIELCEIGHLVDRSVERLSGGERQRVRLATLLAQSPAIMLLDEPLTGLDLEHQYALLHLLEDLTADDQRTVLVVLHDLDIAMRFFDRLLIIDDGRLVADGPPEEVMTPGLLREVFRIHARIGEEPRSRQPVIICERPRPAGGGG